tara:strand:+ start:23324 stop:24211 length:888 start_codon:yes stop_codon:yes gene_type:complete
MKRKKSTDFHPEVLKLFDGYVHGMLSRRDFLDRATAYTVGGVTSATLLKNLSPDFAMGQQVNPSDSRLITSYETFDSPAGYGAIRGYMAKPQQSTDPIPGIIVIHENRGLNPHIEDIVRRLGLEGYLAFAPDGLSSVGGYPGDEDTARELFADLDRSKILQDFIASVNFLQSHNNCNGNVGCIGFCFGGSISGLLAVNIPSLKAAVPFYGTSPSPSDVGNINAPMQFHFAELDERINSGWPASKDALDSAGNIYESYVYSGAQHGFNNDTTPRYDENSANLAWQRSLDFFDSHLR